jgi:hypothetical protein
MAPRRRVTVNGDGVKAKVAEPVLTLNRGALKRWLADSGR